MVINTFALTVKVAKQEVDVFPVSIYVSGSRSITVDNIWTPNDETALILGVERNPGEELDDFLFRTRIIASNRIGPSRDGIISGLAGNTGFVPSWWIEVNCTHTNPEFKVADGSVYLISDYETASIAFMSTNENTGDVTVRTLQDLLDLIDVTDGWSYVVQDTTIPLTDPLYLLLSQSSTLDAKFRTSSGKFIRLDHQNIVEGSVLIFTRTNGMVHEVPIEMRDHMSNGDYCIDYVNGTIYTYDEAPATISGTYSTRKFPYMVSYFEACIFHLEDGIFDQLLYGSGVPAISAEKIIYRSLTKGARTFWSNR